MPSRNAKRNDLTIFQNQKPDRKIESKSGYWGYNRDYLGVRFQIGGETHYGWILISVPYQEGFCYIEAFAYETEPGKAIIAGAVPEPSTILVISMAASIPMLKRRRVSIRA